MSLFSVYTLCTWDLAPLVVNVWILAYLLSIWKQCILETTNPENRKPATIAPETTYPENNKPKPLRCRDCDFWVWVFQKWVKGEEDGEMGFWGLERGLVGKKEEKRNCLLVQKRKHRNQGGVWFTCFVIQFSIFITHNSKIMSLMVKKLFGKW